MFLWFSVTYCLYSAFLIAVLCTAHIVDFLSDLGLPCDKATLFSTAIKETSCRASIHGLSWSIFRKATSAFFFVLLNKLKFTRNGCPFIRFIFETTRRIWTRDTSSDGEGYQEACYSILGYDVVYVARCIYTLVVCKAVVTIWSVKVYHEDHCHINEHRKRVLNKWCVAYPCFSVTWI
jgi:hypothetical protein